MAEEWDGKFTCGYCELDYNANDNVMTLRCKNDTDDPDYSQKTCSTGFGPDCMECETVQIFCDGCWYDLTGETLP